MKCNGLSITTKNIQKNNMASVFKSIDATATKGHHIKPHLAQIIICRQDTVIFFFKIPRFWISHYNKFSFSNKLIMSKISNISAFKRVL